MSTFPFDATGNELDSKDVIYKVIAEKDEDLDNDAQKNQKGNFKEK